MKDFYCYSNRGFFKIGYEDICFYIPVEVTEKSYWVHVNEEITATDYSDYSLICCISGEKIYVYKDEDNKSIVSILKKGTYCVIKNDKADIIINKINSSME